MRFTTIRAILDTAGNASVHKEEWEVDQWGWKRPTPIEDPTIEDKECISKLKQTTYL